MLVQGPSFTGLGNCICEMLSAFGLWKSWSSLDPLVLRCALQEFSMSKIPFGNILSLARSSRCQMDLLKMDLLKSLWEVLVIGNSEVGSASGSQGDIVPKASTPTTIVTRECACHYNSLNHLSAVPLHFSLL